MIEVNWSVLRNEKGLDIGEKVMVRLVGIEIEKGFIDFEGVVKRGPAKGAFGK